MEINTVNKRMVKKLIIINISGRNTQNNIAMPPMYKGKENGRITLFQTILLCGEFLSNSSWNLGRVFAVVISTIPTLIGINKSKFISVLVVEKSIPQWNKNRIIESDKKILSSPLLIRA